jgi:hypothetical protein
VFSVFAIDKAGNKDRTPAERAFEYVAPVGPTPDTTPPETTIDSGPTGLVAEDDPSFAFSSEPDATFRCALDGAADTACASPASFTDVGDGTHLFTVAACDAAGNCDPTPAVRTWTVDTTPPVVNMTVKPTDPSNDASPSFQFTTSEGSTQCKLDSASFAGCTSPNSPLGLADGQHTFTVRATDAAGNLGQDSFTWTVDTTPPTVSFTSTPASLSNDNTPTVAFTTGGAPTSIQCKVDAGAFANCASPFTSTALADGSHTITVRVTDAAGNTSSAQTSSFTIDTVPPAVNITSQPPTQTNDNTPTFDFTKEAGAGAACSIDGGANSSCTNTTSFTSGPLFDGPHTFRITACDAANNCSTDQASFTVDTTPPIVQITNGPSANSASTSASFSFTVTEGTAQCQLDGAGFASCNSSTSHSYTGLSQGGHTFTVRSIDAAGNFDQDSYSWMVDTVPPGPVTGAGFAPSTGACQITFTLPGDAAHAIALRKTTNDISGPNDGTATSLGQIASPHDDSGLTGGVTYYYAVFAVDAAGNTSTAVNGQCTPN